MTHHSEADDLTVVFDGELGDVTDAEVLLIESMLGDLIQGVLLTRPEKE
ncbi:MAG: hypothetical protein MRJ68_09155 [Nitrospira sp.]|nr:hypothetical protein [Nitrospira sp.]